MINVYSSTATDFSDNGIMVLDRYCMTATISEKLNGEYVLRLELAVNSRTVTLANEMVIKVPAPVRYTPAVSISPPASSAEYYEIRTSTGQRLNLRTKPSTSTGKIIKAYTNGTEVVVTSKNGDWYGVTTPDGNSGYMSSSSLRYVRTERPQDAAIPVGGEGKTREQLFRVSSVNATFDAIEVEAQHISYDLRRNYIKTASTAGKTGAEAFSLVLSAAISDHEFLAMSDVTQKIEKDIERKSPIAAILSDGGLVEQAGGELLRDNFNLYWMSKMGRDRGVSIAYRKNMAGMSVEMDTNDLVTRIIPVGYTKDNKPIYGDPVDSPYINDYAQPYILEYEYKDVKVGNTGFGSTAAVKTEVERLAALEYDSGIDKPTVKVAVDYVDLTKTDAGRQFTAFNGIFLGDTIQLKHEDFSYNFAIEVNAYEWDVLMGEYTSLELGTRQMQLADMRITASQLGDGTLPGRKIEAGSISGVELGDVVIGSEGTSITIYAPDSEDSTEIVSIDSSGLHATEISAEKINSDSIVNTASASSVTLATAAEVQVFMATLSGKWMTGDITVNANSASSGTFEVKGVHGQGVLTIYGGSFSSISIRDCSVTVRLNGTIITTAITGIVISNSNVELYGVSLQAGSGAYIERAANVLFSNCTGNCTKLLDAIGNSCIRFVGESIPYGYLGTVQAEIYSPIPFTEYVEPPEVSDITTATLTATSTRTWGGGWLSTGTYGNSLYQGAVNDGALRRGCMWFDTSAIRGRTIVSATLTLRRYSGIGGGSAIAIGIYGTTATGASGTPAIGNKYASLSLANGATGSVDVTAAVQAMANGSINGLMVYDTRTGVYSGKTYTLGYSKLYGVGTDSAPVLSVTYR